MTDQHDPETDFDYTKVRHRQSPFATYISEDVVALLRQAQRLQQFRAELRERADGVSFDLLQNDADYEQALFGGVEPDGTYASNSVAKLFREVFGLQFRDHESAVATYCSGATVETPVVVASTATTDLIDAIVDHGEAIVRSMRECMADWPQQSDRLPEVEQGGGTLVRESEYRDLLTDPATLTGELSTFVEAVQQVLPNYDARALFIHALDHTPRYYLERAYPGLKDPYWWGVEDAAELFEHYEALLGLEPVFEPETDGDSPDDQRVQRDYTLYDYAPDSIGDRLTILYQRLWRAFETDETSSDQVSVREALSTALPELPAYRTAFRDQAEAALDEATLDEDDDWMRPEERPDLRVVDTTDAELEHYQEEYQRRNDAGFNTFDSVRATTEATYEIAGLTLPTCEYSLWGHSTSGNIIDDRNASETVDLNLTRLLDDLAPALYLLHGVDYELTIDADSLTIRRI